MRLCLVAHGFPPVERSGVENLTAQLARGLAARGHAVHVFAPRVRPDLADLSVRREDRDGYVVHWLSANSPPRDPEEALDPPGRAARFAAFLERERPEVVHFQHVVKLGLGLVDAARERGLPTVYTAHDYYPVCHRVTWMRPDLVRCDRLGDAAACARCDLALGLLNQRTELGDYHVGALPEQLEPELSERLAAVLRGDSQGAGLAPGELEAAVERRTRLDRRRAEAFGRFDLVLSPTHFLTERLREGGVLPPEGSSDRPRVVHLPYGIDTAPLLDLPRADADELAARPLRIGFLGSLTKHKGVHVLLEAWQRLGPEPRAELHLWGDSTDRPYVEACRDRARRLGVHWHGAYESQDLPACLARLDVTVVPSLWVENYPIAIREALAAGRPVVVSRVGGLGESVRDGIDGRAFQVGDAEDLARVLAELIDDPAQVVRLREGAGAVHTLEAHVDEHLALYGELIAEASARGAERRAEAPQASLPHLAKVAELHRGLLEAPSGELFQRVLAGIDRLGGLLGAPREVPGELLRLALGGRTRTQDLVRDLNSEREYLRGELDGHRAIEAELEQRAAWRATQVEQMEASLAALQKELAWRANSIADLEASLAALRDEREWQARTVAGLEEGLAHMREERDWRARQAEGLEEAVQSLQAERDWRAGNQEALEARVQDLDAKERQLVADLEETRARADWLEEGLRGAEEAREASLEELRAERELHLKTRAEAAARLKALHEEREQVTEMRAQLAALRRELAELRSELAALGERFERADGERVWRAREMGEALERLSGLGGLGPARWRIGGALERWRRGPDSDGSKADGSPKEAR